MSIPYLATKSGHTSVGTMTAGPPITTREQNPTHRLILASQNANFTYAAMMNYGIYAMPGEVRAARASPTHRLLSVAKS